MSAVIPTRTVAPKPSTSGVGTAAGVVVCGLMLVVVVSEVPVLVSGSPRSFVCVRSLRRIVNQNILRFRLMFAHAETIAALKLRCCGLFVFVCRCLYRSPLTKTPSIDIVVVDCQIVFEK